MNKYMFADRPECADCVSNKGGACIALVDTKCEGLCPFKKETWGVNADNELLKRRIKEGKIPQEILIKYGLAKG